MRGYIYEMSDDIGNIELSGGSLTESDLYDYVPHEFEYVSDLTEAQAKELRSSLTEMFTNLGAKTGKEKNPDGEELPYIIVNDEVRKNYFKNRFEKFKWLAIGMSLDDFISPGAEYHVRTLVNDYFADTVWCGGLYTMDNFIREMKADTKYYIGNVVMGK